jgi:hypothetical protein
LDNANALYGKLIRDFGKLEAAPRDQDAAYNFFVTAYHMHEWIAGNDQAVRRQLEADPLVRVAGHIATRGKHFEASSPKWVQVVSTESRERGPLGGTPAGKPTALRIILSDPNLTPLKSTDITAVDLARCFLEHWREVLSEH